MPSKEEVWSILKNAAGNFGKPVPNREPTPDELYVYNIIKAGGRNFYVPNEDGTSELVGWQPVDKYGWTTFPDTLNTDFQKGTLYNIWTNHTAPPGTQTSPTLVGDPPVEKDSWGPLFGGWLGLDKVATAIGQGIKDAAPVVIPLAALVVMAYSGATVASGLINGGLTSSQIAAGGITAEEAAQAGLTAEEISTMASMDAAELSQGSAMLEQVGIANSGNAATIAESAGGITAASSIDAAEASGGLAAANNAAAANAGLTTAEAAKLTSSGMTIAQATSKAAASGITLKDVIGALPAVAAVGSLGASLLSGGSLTGSSPEVTTTSGLSKYTPEQNKLLKTYTDYYSKIAGDTSLPEYSGSRVAQLNDAQLKAENLLMNYVPYTSTDLGKTATSTLTDVMAGGSGKYFEDAYKKTIEDPLLRNWSEKIVPELSGSYAKKGLLYGSGREDAQLREARTIAEAIAMGRSDLASKMETQRISGVNAANQIGTNALNETTGISSGLSLTGATRQSIEQKNLDTEYSDWLKNQPGTRPQDPIIQSILGLTPYYEPTTVVSGGEQGMLGPLLNAAATYYGMKR